MVFRDKNILLISPEPWDHIFVSKHHYALHLANRGNQVFFLGPPSDEVKLSATQIKNLFLLRYTGFPKGLRFYPRFFQKRIIAKVYKQLENICSNKFDVIWSFDNSVFFDFGALPYHVVKICHIVDLNQDFQTRRAASTADYCFCTTELIKNRLSNYSSRVFKITHGYNTLASDQRLSSTLKRGPQAVYAGNLGMPYIDWVLLLAIVKGNPQVEFFFIGPNGRLCEKNLMGNAKNKITESENCHFIGKVDSNLLHKYYRTADILLVAYQEKFHDDQASPHKMMEYLGSGQMIVATYTAEYVDLSDKGLFKMSKMNADFSIIFKEVLAELKYWNSNRLQTARKAFASANSYEKQIDRIQEIIK